MLLLVLPFITLFGVVILQINRHPPTHFKFFVDPFKFSRIGRAQILIVGDFTLRHLVNTVAEAVLGDGSAQQSLCLFEQVNQQLLLIVNERHVFLLVLAHAEQLHLLATEPLVDWLER